MFERGLLLLLYTETPTHAGAGESATVDLAIQRNPTLDWPMVQAPGLKGALRTVAPGGNDAEAQWRHLVFGPDKDDKRPQSAETFIPRNGSEHAGALAIGDATLLAFPIVSLAGVFGWITCRQAIRDFQRTYHFLPPSAETALPAANAAFDWGWDPPIVQDDEAFWLDDSSLRIEPGTIVLQDIVLNTVNGDTTTTDRSALGTFASALAANALPPAPLTLRKKFEQDLVLVSDSVFTGLVEAGIHVITRVKIDDNTGTAAASGPWDEELLPAETILYAPVLASMGRSVYGEVQQGNYLNADSVLDYFSKRVARAEGKPRHFQLGGDATVGRGWLYAAPYTIVAPMPDGSDAETATGSSPSSSEETTDAATHS